VLESDEEVDGVPVVDDEAVVEGAAVSATEPTLKANDRELCAGALNVSVVGLLQFTLLFWASPS
jgi:hypothetical protein